MSILRFLYSKYRVLYGGGGGGGGGRPGNPVLTVITGFFYSRYLYLCLLSWYFGRVYLLDQDFQLGRGTGVHESCTIYSCVSFFYQEGGGGGGGRGRISQGFLKHCHWLVNVFRMSVEHDSYKLVHSTSVAQWVLQVGVED